MKKRLLALLLSLVMLLTCMGAGLEAAISNDDGSDSAEQTVTTAPVESTETPDGEDTTPTDGETPSGEPATDDDTTEQPEETAAPTEAPEDETKEPAGGEDSAAVDGEDEDTASDDEEAVEEDAGVDEDTDAEEDTDTDSEPVYPLVSFTNVAPFLEPVTGTGSTSAIGKVVDAITGVFTGIIDRITGGDASVQTVDDGTDTSGSDTGDGTKTSGLNVSKTATYNSETKDYTITLEAYATGEKVTTVTKKSIPTDIILVLDLSKSMNQSMSSEQGHGKKSETRLEALKSACTSFAEAVAASAKGADGNFGTEDDIEHRIAIVGYNSSANIKTGSSAANAFLKMNNAANLATMKTTITNLSTNENTKTDSGLEKAIEIFKENTIPEGETRNRVVVLFTDGYPNTANKSDNFDTTIAQNAIKAATTLKNTPYGATVYSVAVLSGADPNAEVKTSDWSGNNNDKKVNLFLHNVSSNVSKDKSSTDGTNPQEPDTSGYYLTAASADDLKEIFTKISEQIDSTGGSSSKLTSDAVVKDVISDQFKLPENADKNSITIKTYKYSGDSYTAENAWTENVNDAMGAEASIDANGTVSVIGFDFSANWCGTDKDNGVTNYRGNKLVISFNVVPKDGFLGGNDVFTNSSAGVYENAAAAESGKATVEFTKPTVNVPIQSVDVTANDQNVYLLGSVTGEQLKNGATVKVGSVTLDLSKANNPDKPYGLEKWQTEYVNITVTVKDESGNVVTDETFKNLTKDAKYTVSVSVKPTTQGTDTDKKGPAATDQTDSKDANINVFKPVLTFKDSTAYYGETVPTSNDYSSNQVGTEATWKHDTKTDNSVTMLGEKPKLAVSFTPDANKLENGKYTKEDVPVSATVKIGEEDVSTHTTFEHQDCTGKTCTLSDGYHFWIHVKTCTLTIKKTGGAAGESYVFDVYKDGVKYTEVAIEGDIEGKGTAMIYELPVGTYTIEEDTGWSWRYGKNDNSKPSYTPADGVTLSAANDEGTITCTNSNPFAYWLNGFSAIVRNIIKAVTT